MPYRSSHTRSLADLLMQQGEIAARQTENRGRIWGDAVSGIGQRVAQGIQSEQQRRQDAPRLAMRDEADRLDLDLKRRGVAADDREIADRESARQRAEHVTKVNDWLTDIAAADDPEQQKATYAAGREKLMAEGIFQPTDAPEFFPGKSWIKAKAIKLLPEKERYDKLFPPEQAPEPLVEVGPDAILTPRSQAAGQPAYKAPAAPEPLHPVGPHGILTPRSQAAGQSVYRPPAAPAAGPRSPIWVVGPDGQFKDLAGVAPPGSKPANTREQGRAVVSGDANRIADLDTSLNDLDTLETQLGTTGAASKVGAMLPNAVTEFTGWGMDAKSRQGTIDRVKQVIGKALEGGVLRKEDEYKYTKILPTIGDPPDVAKSKLNGLRNALAERRQTTLDALADAGYDTSRFNARTPAAAPKADPLGIR